MTLLRWKPEYSIGIEAVDYEHKKLIELINRIYDEFGGADAMQSTPAFLGDLLEAVSAHFALEEKLMRDRDYERYRPHKDDHERLLDELCEIMDDIERSPLIDSAGLVRRLETWFVGHFKSHDAELHQWQEAEAG